MQVPLDIFIKCELVVVIILLMILIIKLIVTTNKVNDLLDDVSQKVKSFDKVFEIVDVVNDKVAMIGDATVGLMSGVVKKFFKNKKKSKNESEEDEDE